MGHIIGELNRKRNKSSTKSYNTKEQLDNSVMSYGSHINNKNLTNNLLDMSQLSSNQTSITKNLDTSFHFGIPPSVPNFKSSKRP